MTDTLRNPKNGREKLVTQNLYFQCVRYSQFEDFVYSLEHSGIDLHSDTTIGKMRTALSAQSKSLPPALTSESELFRALMMTLHSTYHSFKNKTPRSINILSSKVTRIRRRIEDQPHEFVSIKKLLS